MIEQTNLLPKRRFKEFKNSGLWEQRKVFECGNKIFGGGTPKTGLEEYWNGNIPWIQSSDLIEDVLVVKEPRKKITEEAIKNSATKIIPKNSIAVVTRVGVGKLALMEVEYATSQDFISISNLKLDKWFTTYVLYHLLQKEKKSVQGTSIKGMTKDDLISKKITTPTSNNEQQRIGEYFLKLDNLITLQKRKLEKTKALKAAYLSEMFPVEGETEPKRRFDGFTQAWEQRRIEDLAEVSTGKAFSSKDFSTEGKYLVVTNKNIQDEEKGIISIGDRIDISENEILNNYVLSGNNILVTMDGVNIGKTGKYSNEKAVLAQRVGRLKSDQLDFIYQITSNNKFISEMNRISVGNAIKHISLSQISKYSFMAPVCIDEQAKIGNFFKKLDDIITHHQRKLEKLQNLKKAYLTEMFV